MKFHLQADAYFEAKDIDDALAKLGEFFAKRRSSEEMNIVDNGEILLAPVVEYKRNENGSNI